MQVGKKVSLETAMLLGLTVRVNAPDGSVARVTFSHTDKGIAIKWSSDYEIASVDMKALAQVLADGRLWLTVIDEDQ